MERPNFGELGSSTRWKGDLRRCGQVAAHGPPDTSSKQWDEAVIGTM